MLFYKSLTVVVVERRRTVEERRKLRCGNGFAKMTDCGAAGTIAPIFRTDHHSDPTRCADRRRNVDECGSFARFQQAADLFNTRREHDVGFRRLLGAIERMNNC